MISLSDSLRSIGEPKPGMTIPPFPSGFHSTPRTINAAIHAMKSPRMESWTLGCEAYAENHTWTEECQGLASDGNAWFIVSNNEHDDYRAIYKFGFDLTPISNVKSPWGGNHIGAPCYFDGRIYVPVEGDKAHVWMLDKDLNDLGSGVLGGTGEAPQGGSMPWCAINPWNGYLYSSIFGHEDRDRFDYGNVDRVYCYDPRKDFVLTSKKSMLLRGEVLHRVQGGCISKNGHLYLTSSRTNDIRGYNVLNGAYIGRYGPPSDWTDDEEMEGIAIVGLTCSNGASVDIHTMILDNDKPDYDDIYIKHISVPYRDNL